MFILFILFIDIRNRIERIKAYLRRLIHYKNEKNKPNSTQIPDSVKKQSRRNRIEISKFQKIEGRPKTLTPNRDVKNPSTKHRVAEEEKGGKSQRKSIRIHEPHQKKKGEHELKGKKQKRSKLKLSKKGKWSEL